MTDQAYLQKINGNPGFVDGATIPPFASKAALDASGSGWEIGTIANAAGVPYSWRGAGVGWVGCPQEIGTYIGGATGSPVDLTFSRVEVIDPKQFIDASETDYTVPLLQATTWQHDTTQAGSNFSILNGTAKFAEVTAAERFICVKNKTPVNARWRIESSISIPGAADVATLQIISADRHTSIALDITQSNWTLRIKTYGDARGSETGSYAFGEHPEIRFTWRRNSGTVHVFAEGVWVYLGGINADPAAWDGTKPLTIYNWTGFTFAFGTKNVATGPVAFSKIIIGHPQIVGLRDQQLVTNEDGTPYSDGTHYYMTATAGVATPTAGDGVANSECVILRVNRATFSAEITGYIYIYRAAYEDPAWLGNYSDSPIFVMLDRETGYWNLFASSFGDGMSNAAKNHLNVVYAKTKSSPLHGEAFIDASVRPWLPLPPSMVMVYDPHIVKYGGLWHCVATFGSTHSAYGQHVYYANATTLDGLTTAAFVDIGTDGEGAKFFMFSGGLYISAQNKIYSVIDGATAYVGNLSITLSGFVYPHVQPIPIPLGNRTKWRVCTFDQTQVEGAAFSNGQWHIFDSQIFPYVEVV